MSVSVTAAQGSVEGVNTDNYTVARRSALAKAVYASKGFCGYNNELAVCNTLVITSAWFFGAVVSQ